MESNECFHAPVDAAFTKALPKVELHAHLSGSISAETLHTIWLKKKAEGKCLDLEDPLTAIKAGDDGFVDIVSFFPLFDKYIYALCNDVETVRFATLKVLEEFAGDGVRYLELRTTPRANEKTGMTRKDYVFAVNEVVHDWNTKRGDEMQVYLLLSIDRKMTAKTAQDIVHMASELFHWLRNADSYVIGLDLCGNPMKGDVTNFTDVIRPATEVGKDLFLTVHFAEISESSTDEELSTLLSWSPDRLGHCIHPSRKHESFIKKEKIALELCLSCNVLGKLTTGSYGDHHLDKWINEPACSVALGTDDVGIFGSSLSNEYLLAAKHLGLSRYDVVQLAKQAADAAFGPVNRILTMLDDFEKNMDGI